VRGFLFEDRMWLVLQETSEKFDLNSMLVLFALYWKFIFEYESEQEGLIRVLLKGVGNQLIESSLVADLLTMGFKSNALRNVS